MQYIVEGVERMGYAPLHNGLAVRQAYDPQKDFLMYDATGDFFAVRAGSFAIFSPHDLHAPGIAADAPGAPQEVCKVVVKCRVG